MCATRFCLLTKISKNPERNGTERNGQARFAHSNGKGASAIIFYITIFPTLDVGVCTASWSVLDGLGLQKIPEMNELAADKYHVKI